MLRRYNEKIQTSSTLRVEISKSLTTFLNLKFFCASILRILSHESSVTLPLNFSIKSQIFSKIFYIFSSFKNLKTFFQREASRSKKDRLHLPVKESSSQTTENYKYNFSYYFPMTAVVQRISNGSV